MYHFILDRSGYPFYAMLQIEGLITIHKLMKLYDTQIFLT